MEIGILSMQKVLNFGSVLQAYSLKAMIEDTLHAKVSFIDIDWNGQIQTKMPILDSDDYASNPYIDTSKFMYYMKKIHNKGCKIRIKNRLEAFQKKELNLSETCNSKYYDLVIVGSDEVFMAKKYLSPQLYGKIDNAKHIVSYAASCGSAVYEGLPVNRLPEIRKFLSNYEMMSVRDRHTKEYISKLYDGNIEMHLDPVLMGPLYQVKHQRRLKSKYLLIYAYGDRIRTEKEIVAIKTFAERKKLSIVAVGAPQYWADKSVVCSPMALLDYFYYADYVVTDTFHGAVFSIITNRRFCVFSRNSNKFKLLGLLELLNLHDRVVNNIDEMAETLESSIDYNRINALLEKERVKAEDYLKKAIALSE